jgi:hypothetical protein
MIVAEIVDVLQQFGQPMNGVNHISIDLLSVKDVTKVIKEVRDGFW